MVICIAGMHRSGTSMVARLLNAAGLYLGDEEDLVPPSSHNPEGHWEHAKLVEINDDILAEFGGGWDYPPDLSDLADAARVGSIDRKARQVLRQFAERRAWGWKDPRNSLTLPFWRKLIPDVRVVVCLRNPLEVAESLRRRGGSSYALGISLWTTYNQRLIQATRPDERVVTHYVSYLDDPAAELRRIATRLQMPVPDDTLDTIRGTTKRELRHGRFTTADLVASGISPRVVELYEQLCAEAQHVDREGQPSEPRRGERAEGAVPQDSLRGVRASEGTWARASIALPQLREEPASARLEAELRRERELRLRLEDAIAYLHLRQRLLESMHAAIPLEATVLVISRGDESLVALHGRRVWHFPRTTDGVWAGHYPADGRAAIAALERLRSEGATYLVVPEPARWWLEYYPELRAHLRRYEVVVDRADTGMIVNVSGDVHTR